MTTKAEASLTNSSIIEDVYSGYFSRAAQQQGGVVRVFINNAGASVQDSDFGVIQTKPVSWFNVYTIKRTLSQVASFSAIRFQYIDSPESANISFSEVSSAKATFPGLSGEFTALTTWPEDGRFDVNVYLSGEFNSHNRSCEAMHETGHALGLEHPFEPRDGDVFGTEESTNTDQTVMAYAGGTVDCSELRPLDKDALKQIWGAASEGASAYIRKFELLDESLDRFMIKPSELGGAASGGEGVDIIGSGVGRCTLTGGISSDVFVFNTMERFSSRSADVVTDFRPEGDDKIVLDRNAFSRLGDTSTLTTVSSKRGLAKAARSSSVIIYFQTTGQLFYNENGGKDSFGKGGLFANLSASPVLEAEDIMWI